jgi:hypothetical protein
MEDVRYEPPYRLSKPHVFFTGGFLLGLLETRFGKIILIRRLKRFIGVS